MHSPFHFCLKRLLTKGLMSEGGGSSAFTFQKHSRHLYIDSRDFQIDSRTFFIHGDVFLFNAVVCSEGEVKAMNPCLHHSNTDEHWIVKE